MTAPLLLPEHTSRFLTLPGLSELLLSRDVGLIAPGMLDRVILECQAGAGALLFVGQPGSAPVRIRHGDWSEPALRQLSRWEQAVLQELQQRRMYIVTVPAPSEARVSDGAIILLVNVPLLAGAEVVGTLTVGFTSEFPIPPDYRTMLQHAAANVGILLRLVHDLSVGREKLTQLELFFQIGQRMVSTLDLNRLLVDTVGIAASIVNASAASLMLIDEERRELIFEIALGEKGAVLQHSRIPMDEGIAGWVATRGKPLIVNDVARDPRFSRQIDARTGFLTQSVLCVPLQIKGKTIGVLEVLNKYSGEGFDQEDEAMLMTIAGQAAIAIENARLYQSLREERDKIITAQEDVRKELARNLHDGIAAQLTAINWNIDHIERLLQMKPEEVPAELESVRQLTRQASRQVRLLLFELRPVVLETRGLLAALQSYVEQLSSDQSLRVHLEAQPYAGRIRPKIEGTIFSIVQEAVNNARRHGKPQNIWLRLSVNTEHLHVEVEDDGLGFNRLEVERNYDERGSLGLLNMRERAALLDGILAVHSLGEGRERGTLVTLDVPLRPEVWETPPPAVSGPAEREEMGQNGRAHTADQ
ncbi:MAG: GAF domain-containing sensor histidine kinase [Anaerolineae bacterium]